MAALGLVCPSLRLVLLVVVALVERVSGAVFVCVLKDSIVPLRSHVFHATTSSRAVRMPLVSFDF